MRDAVAGLTLGGFALLILGAFLSFIELWSSNGGLLGLFVLGVGVLMLVLAGVVADRAKKISRNRS